ncbi:Inactive purple acid phosphatase-like protein [Citrus sinensis]|nr:Inactive purple acid phosphatase-like protein [Citrus sinensis]
MASSSRGFTTQLDFRLRRPVDISRGQVNGLDEPRKRKRVSFEGERIGVSRISCCCSDPVVPIRSCKSVEKCEEWRFDPKKSSHRSRIQASPSMPFASSQSCSVSKQGKFYPRCTPRNSGPQSRDSPPKRDTGIANEKDWGISLLNENVNETGTNEDGSTWYRESGEDLGENGYRCRWTRMGGRSHDDSSEWKETWWEKSDWTGYKELGVEKSGRNAEGDSWWETWQEVLHQDEWSNLARIERSAQKQAKSGTENAGWYEKWWEKYDAKGWTEKGAHKTDKWAETELGTKWGDKWEEKFFAGIGSRQGETWHVSPSGELVCFVNHPHKVIVIFVHRKVHKYGKSTTGESWDIVVDEETYYEAEPHYGWADVVGDSSQLLSIQPRDRPPGVFPNLDFGPSPDPADDQPG